MYNTADWPNMAIGKFAPDPIILEPWDPVDPWLPRDPPILPEDPPKDGGGAQGEDPWGGGGGGGIKSYPTYSGIVRDATSETPLPNATVRFYDFGGSVIDQVITGATGTFSRTGPAAETVTITSVGYKGFTWPASEYQHTFDLERDEKILDPVIVTASRKIPWIILGVIGYMVYKQSKKGSR